MSNQLLKQAIQQQFAYNPTVGQQELFDKFADFIFSKNTSDCFVLQGYAGTGKTTIVSALVNILPRFGLTSILLAPTGRAAKVISSYSGNRAYTLHKHLYKSELTEYGISVVLKENKAKNALFIVDEISMLSANAGTWDRNLMNDLFEFVYTGTNCKLLLIGDDAQLPPVGEDDSLVFDLNYLQSSYNVSIWHHKLTEVVRQQEESGILFNATNLRIKIMATDYNLPLFDLKNFTDIEVIDGYMLEDKLNTLYDRNGIENVVVICRSNKEANQFNLEIRKRILFKEEEISAGDLLMVVKNNYYWLASTSKAGFIANGDMIEILKVRKIEELYGFKFADVVIRLIDYPEEKELDVKLLMNTLHSETPSLSQAENTTLYNAVMEDCMEAKTKRDRYKMLKQNPHFNALQIKYAYALTCHKTQGGQWENVVVSKGFVKKEMIDRNYFRWLYTAITRSTMKLHLLNFDEPFFK